MLPSTTLLPVASYWM